MRKTVGRIVNSRTRHAADVGVGAILHILVGQMARHVLNVGSLIILVVNVEASKFQAKTQIGNNRSTVNRDARLSAGAS